MNIVCPSCQRTIASENINHDQAIAKCNACNAIFSVAKELPLNRAQIRREQKQSVSLSPKGIILADSGGSLSISLRWLHISESVCFFFCFSIIWDIVILFLFSLLLNQSEIPWLAVISLLWFVPAGIAMNYATLATLFNTTTAIVNYQNLIVVHKPIPWAPKQTFARRDIDWFYTVENVTQHQNAVSRTYEIRMVQKDRTEHPLLTNLLKLEQAFYIEQALKRYLQIRDRRIPGKFLR